MTDKRRYDPIKRIEQFWQKVDKNGPVALINGVESRCWLYLGVPQNKGYGHICVNYKPVLAHRFAWILMIGEIPDGLTLDHLCRRTMCVNPAHLEPVTHRVNVLRGIGRTAINARKTHCKWGHPLSGENLG